MSLKCYYIIGIMLALDSGAVQGLRCYRCGGGSDEKPCDQLIFTDSQFIAECESSAKGCMTESLDNAVNQRSCWSQGDNSCRDEENVNRRICTCDSDLCNCYSQANIEEGELSKCPAHGASPLKSASVKPSPTLLMPVVALGILLLHRLSL